MAYASGGAIQYHHVAMQLCEVLQWELIDHTPGIDKAYLKMSL
jgi:hypothetical protein